MRVAVIDPSLYTPPYDSALIGGLHGCGHCVRLFGRPPRTTDVPLGTHVDLSPVFYALTERRRGVLRGPWLPLAKAVEHCFNFGALERELRAFRPDVVHWQWPSVPAIDIGFLRALARSWPQVVTVHDTNLFHRSGLARLRTLGWDSFIRSADQVIVHLESSRNVLRSRGISDERINVVRHGVFARPNAINPTRAPGSRLRVLFFGRIVLNKGIQTLIEAVTLLSTEVRVRMELHVAGALRVPTDKWRRLLAKASLGDTLRLRAEFIPEEELDALIAGADIVVLPHLDVDASGALMKAIAYDTSIVVSDIPSFVETLGGTGAVEFFGAGDPTSLAGVLQRLIMQEDTRQVLRDRVKVLRAGALSWPVLAEQTADVYRKAQRMAKEARRS
jgi:glycosyltransferase involved in cell wall biosynthesis